MGVSAHLPLSCPKMDINHSADQGMVSHGTCENPILVKEMRTDCGQYVDWEYRFISGEVGHYVRCFQAMLEFDHDRRVDRVVVRTPNGIHHVFNFDITQQCKTQMDQFEEVMKKMGICPKCGNETPSNLHQCT